MSLAHWVHELEERLSESRSFEERILIANTFFLGRCSTLPSPDGITATAMSILYRRGSVQIPTLAQRAGMSTRQFERTIHPRNRTTSQTLCANRQIRISSRSKALSTADTWTNVANRLGYFDQMHMIKDFKEFSGEIPTSLARSA